MLYQAQSHLTLHREKLWGGNYTGNPFRVQAGLTGARKGSPLAFIPLGFVLRTGVLGRPKGSPCGSVSLGQGKGLGNGGPRAEVPGLEFRPGEPGAPNPAPPRLAHHSRSIFHLDRAHPAEASALGDVRAVAQQPAAAALEVLLVPEREAGGRRTWRGGAAHAAAGEKGGTKERFSVGPAPSRAQARPRRVEGGEERGAPPGLRAASGCPSPRPPPPRGYPAPAPSIHPVG